MAWKAPSTSIRKSWPHSKPALRATDLSHRDESEVAKSPVCSNPSVDGRLVIQENCRRVSEVRHSALPCYHDYFNFGVAWADEYEYHEHTVHGGSSPSSSDAGNRSVNPSYTVNAPCSTDAAGLMSRVESDFSKFGDYTGNFGPGGVPAATGVVAFGKGPLVEGGTVPISNVNLVGGSHAIPFNVSVTVATLFPTSFTFVTNPGHVLHPASITFSASDAGAGRINFSIQVSGNFASGYHWALYHAGGNDLENNIWNHFLHNVQAACGGRTPGPG
jgi:hypothetical protein